MKKLFVLGLMVTGCSGGAQAYKSDGPPRCLDLCSANFTQCTERNPGDYTACSSQRARCDQDCRAEHAESETTNSDPKVLGPNDMVPSQTATQPEPQPNEEVPESE